MRMRVANYPNITLTNLLRRRKTTLKEFIEKNGITTYELLLGRCSRLGVAAPSEEEFHAVVPVRVTSPTEGVVVLEPPPVVIESTGERIEESEEVTSPVDSEEVTYAAEDPLEEFRGPETVNYNKKKKK